MNDRIERGTYEHISAMHQVAIVNNWIAIFGHDVEGYYLRLIGKIKNAS